jgi:Pyridoxamine 5'-phosphate oxidase
MESGRALGFWRRNRQDLVDWPVNAAGNVHRFAASDFTKRIPRRPAPSVFWLRFSCRWRLGSMGKIYERIDERIEKWIGAQKVFFVATAPLDPKGHLNCSPKDGNSIRVLDSKTLVYLDLIGSGVETIAHIRENGRIIVMMCAFEGAPTIMRFHGHGEVIEKGHPDFEHLAQLFVPEVGIRSFIKIHLERISDSCGFGVPVMEFKHHRNQLRAYCERNGEEKMTAYKIKHNSWSIDGLPGVKRSEE